MGDGTKQNPFTRKDVLKAIEENGGTAKGLDLSEKVFEEGIDLRDLDLKRIILERTVFKRITEKALIKKGIKLELDERENGPNIGALLTRAHLEGALLMGAHLEEAMLEDAHLGEADLTGTHLEKSLLYFAHLEKASLANANLESANLMYAHLEGAYLENVKLSPDTSLEDVDWGNYILGEEKENIGSEVNLYRRLKLWYTHAGIADIAAKFYYREKEAGRKALKWRSKSTFWHRLALEASHIFFGYGEKWWNIILWIAVVIFGLAGAYRLFGGLNISHSIYYSVVSFTALGYGSWVSSPPEVWVQRIGAAESFVGVSMMALLLVTFVRKWTR